MITQRPCPTGVIVHVGLAPFVFTIPVQSPCSSNGPANPDCENVSGAGVEVVTVANWMFAGEATTGAGFGSGGGFDGIDDGTGVGVAAFAPTASNTR